MVLSAWLAHVQLCTDHFPPLPAATLYSQVNIKINWSWQLFHRRLKTSII